MCKKNTHMIVGARPNYMKIAPLYHEFIKHSVSYSVKLVHTGQHYDENKSHLFFVELGKPVPDSLVQMALEPMGINCINHRTI
jgi:UDP-N-acetylglucosamine 2-epimerase (non-hydrolysing)